MMQHNEQPALPQTPTGVPGLDTALHGGLPRGRNALLVGAPGSGKTMLALQFLVNGVAHASESGMIVSFEEAPDRLRAAAHVLGLSAETTAEPNVHFYDGRPIIDALTAGPFDLGGLVAIVGSHIKRLGLRRIVFDGLDALFAASGGNIPAMEFRRLVTLTNVEALTSLICIKPGRGNDDIPLQFDSLEYVADAVIRLGYRVESGLLQRILRIVKIRNADFAAGEHPFIITAHGLDVSYAPAIKAEPVISRERVSTGIPQLDGMMEGGVLRCTTTLISGLPGTAKSTIGAAFLSAGLAAGERALLIALDEPAAQLIENVRSVGIELAPYLATGQLITLSLNAASAIADDHYLRIERLIQKHRPSLLVIDPVSALDKAGGRNVAMLNIERLTVLIKSLGLTAVFTAVSNSVLDDLESTTTLISAVADTWIHVSFAVKGGERNRTLTIVKSRGTAHSNQLREMILSPHGIALQDVYQIQGDFLLGTARLEREQEQKRDEAARETTIKNLLRALDERKEIALAKLRDAQREVYDVNEEMAAGIEESASLAAHVILDRTEVDAARGTREV